MLQNEYLVAKIGVDTAENGPSKVSGKGNPKVGVATVGATLRRRALGLFVGKRSPLSTRRRLTMFDIALTSEDFLREALRSLE